MGELRLALEAAVAVDAKEASDLPQLIPDGTLSINNLLTIIW